jgi:hypothetical protein
MNYDRKSFIALGLVFRIDGVMEVRISAPRTMFRKIMAVPSFSRTGERSLNHFV